MDPFSKAGLADVGLGLAGHWSHAVRLRYQSGRLLDRRLFLRLCQVHVYVSAQVARRTGHYAIDKLPGRDGTPPSSSSIGTLYESRKKAALLPREGTCTRH